MYYTGRENLSRKRLCGQNMSSIKFSLVAIFGMIAAWKGAYYRCMVKGLCRQFLPERKSRGVIFMILRNARLKVRRFSKPTA